MQAETGIKVSTLLGLILISLVYSPDRTIFLCPWMHEVWFEKLAVSRKHVR